MATLHPETIDKLEWLIDQHKRLCDGLTNALDLMEGMMAGAMILRGNTGVIKVKPTADMKRLRALVAEAQADG